MDRPEPTVPRLSAVEELLAAGAILPQRGSDNTFSGPTVDLGGPAQSKSGEPLPSPSAVLQTGEDESAQESPLTRLRDAAAATPLEDLAPPYLLLPEQIALGEAMEESADAAPRLSAVEELLQAASLPLSGPQADQAPHTTVAPSELALSSLTDEGLLGADLETTAASTTEIETLADGIMPSLEANSTAVDAEPESSLPSFVKPIIDLDPNEFIITLPLAANMRPRYTGVLLDSRVAIEDFTSIFAKNVFEAPVPALVSRIDDLFQQLLELCDLPAWDASLPSLEPEAMKRHATGTNSKYSFVLELLLGLNEFAGDVLLLARPGKTMAVLEALVSTENFRYRKLGKGRSHVYNNDSFSPLSVILADTEQDLAQLPAPPDAVVAFDQAARTAYHNSWLAKQSPFKKQTVMSLVAAGTLEHIDMRLSNALQPLERKNALVIALVQSRGLVGNPGALTPDDTHEPHKIAELFAKRIQNVNDEDQEEAWVPYEIPEEIFDFFPPQVEPRQAQTEILAREEDTSRSTSRKRQFDDVDEGTPKRARLGDSISALIDTRRVVVSDALSTALATSLPPSAPLSGQVFEAPVEQLEALATKIQELDDQVKEKEQSEADLRTLVQSLEAQLRSHEKSIRKIQPPYMEALRDRGILEAQRDEAREQTRDAERRLAAAEADTTRLKDANSQLEAKIASMAAAALGAPGADPATSDRLAQLEQELQAATAQREALDKKARSADGELQYVRDAYQAASTRAGELEREREAQAAERADLERRAAANALEIHRIDAQMQRGEAARLLEEARAVARDRERELERAREEIRVLRNGRRDTRQVSVPKSPRMMGVGMGVGGGGGLMSPRPGRSGGGGGAGGAGGAGSRGTSPAPGPSGFDGVGAAAAGGVGSAPPLTAFYGHQPPTGRWNHLRE